MAPLKRRKKEDRLFSYRLFTSNEVCDKCGKNFSPENPGLELECKFPKHERHIVWLHIDELELMIKKSKEQLKRELDAKAI